VIRVLPDRRDSVLDRAFLDFGASRPGTRMDVGLISYLTGAPPRLDDLRNILEASLERLPVLTHRLVGPASSARWEPTPDFRLDRHVLEAITESPGRDGVAETAHRLVEQPLPPDTPWQLWLVSSSSQDCYGLCYRVHHAWQDGVGMAQMLLAIFSSMASEERPPPRPTEHWALRGVRAMTMATRMLGEVLRPIAPGPASGWKLSGDRRLSTAAAPLAPLRAVARACGGTVNDVHLAAVSGAIRAWSLEAGRQPAPLAVTVPVNVRNPQERPGWGNYFMPRRVWLPCEEGEPSRRLSRTVIATRGLKSVRDRQSARDMLFTAPSFLVRFGTHRTMDPRYAPVIASYVPCDDAGMIDSMGMTDMVPLTLLPPGHPFNVCLTTFGDTAQIAVISDKAVPFADRLPLLWREAVDELTTAFAMPDGAAGR
jgi:diacylglycerol O-acyltransferase